MNLSLFFSSFALFLGISVSVRIFIEWFRRERRHWFLFFWGSGLFLFFWFQVPLILTSLGRAVTVSRFNLFFALTFPVAFLALILIYFGIIDFMGLGLRKKTKLILFIYFLASVIFFAWQFIANGGVIQTYALPLVGNIVFYIPLRALIALTLIKWLFEEKTVPFLGVFGASAIILESIIGIIRNALVIKNVLTYPPEFWYVVLSGLKIFFILQTASVILLAVGFYMLNRMYHQSDPAEALKGSS